MKKFVLWSGWVTAFLLCVTAGMLYLWGAQQAEKATRLGIERSSQEAVLNDLKKKVAAPAETGTQTKPGNDKESTTPVTAVPAPQLPPVPATVPATLPVPPASTTPIPASVPTPIPGSGPAPQGATGPVPPVMPTNQAPSLSAPSISTPLTSVPSSPVVSPQITASTMAMGAQALANTYYAAYFTKVRLPKEIEQQVRKVLQQYQEARQQLTRHLMQNELSVEEYANRIVSVRNQVRGDLGGIINPADMSAWNEYEMTLPERLMRQHVENVLMTEITTLSLAARAHIADVLVQEMKPIFEAQHNGFLPLELERGIAARPVAEAYARARTRLEKDFSPEEMNQAGLFLERQLSKITSAQ